MRELPIACSLDAAAMGERLAEMRAIGSDALVSAVPGVLRFRPGPETRARLERIVAAEAECCAFLDLALEDEPGALRLTIAGPEGAEPIVAGMVAAFAGEPSAR